MWLLCYRVTGDRMPTPAICEPASTLVNMDAFAAASLRREYKLEPRIRKMFFRSPRRNAAKRGRRVGLVLVRNLIARGTLVLADALATLAT
jgi:hypothetical protein